MIGKKSEDFFKAIAKKGRTENSQKAVQKSPFNFTAIPKIPTDDTMSTARLYLKFSDTLSNSIFTMYK